MRASKTAILLATYNGEMFLGEQLQSLAAQDVDNLDVWLSDDGSTDQTLEIASAHKSDWTKGRFKILTARNPEIPKTPGGGSKVELSLRGANENFRSLILNADIQSDNYAFCDQDDVWESDKLSTALEWLEAQDKNQPAMYCSRTKNINVDGNTVGHSPLFERQPCFGNALIQNIAGGNTIVVNNAAMQILRQAFLNSEFVSHDWWCYIVISAVGGNIHYSSKAKTHYRQHQDNIIGENNSWSARMARLSFALSGRFKLWNDQNLKALDALPFDISNEAKVLIDCFEKNRSMGRVRGFLNFPGKVIFRQSRLGQVSLYVARLLGKI